MIQLFIGGVRSGKSAAAETHLKQTLEKDSQLIPAYIATSLATDPETIIRIKRHQKQRLHFFEQQIKCYEVDYHSRDLLAILSVLDESKHIVLIECLSTWVSWYLTQSEDLQGNLTQFYKEQEKLLSFLRQARCEVVIVSGEVGCGLIGETTLQRRYADCLGELNQQIAQLADHVYLVTAGITQQIKSNQD